jgi:hypothetical protein
VPHVVSEDKLTSLARTVMTQGARVQSRFVVLHANKWCLIKIRSIGHCFLPLPNNLQSELHVPGLRRQRIHESIGCNRPGRVKDPGASKRLRRQKV